MSVSGTILVVMKSGNVWGVIVMIMIQGVYLWPIYIFLFIYQWLTSAIFL